MRKIIAVDFDGTICDNEWPRIGKPHQDVIDYILSEQKKGAHLILWTCRTGSTLDDAITWCKERGIIFDSINDGAKEAIEVFGGDSRKIFAHEYIDDRMCTKFNFKKDEM